MRPGGGALVEEAKVTTRGGGAGMLFEEATLGRRGWKGESGQARVGRSGWAGETGLLVNEATMGL